jgi:hypothetical protein
MRSLRILAAVLAAPALLFAGGGKPTLLGWNNLGMHCMDDDFDVFCILPPYNTVNAQLLDASGHLVRSPAGISVTYEAVADADGSITRTSAGKTNFWANTRNLFGAAPATDLGLAGFAMPGRTNTPQRFAWAGTTTRPWFEATGIPITPTDDAGRHNSYPMMRLKARDGKGALLAQVDVVLPVSDEMDCRACHASGSGAAARPAAGWVNDPNPKHDFRFNILRLHDEKNARSALYQSALRTTGYASAGLYASARAGVSVLCAECHSSEALPGMGVAGVPPLTRAIHGRHALVLSPRSGLTLNATANRAACYECHPGSTTQCLRGAMGAAVNATNGQLAMQCQSCHGSISQVAATTRTGWLDEPNCQACHTGTARQNSGQIRYTQAILPDGTFRQPKSAVFATNPNTPAPGKSLYRFSSGHGGLQCSACHGSTHAEFISSHRNDNVASTQLQGHAGVVTECLACHATLPNTVAGGPHGMHPIGGAWISRHEDAASAACQDCHGLGGRGTVLSRTKAARTFTTEHGTVTFWSGQTISCYECHNGPGGEGRAPAAPVVAATLSLTTPNSTTSVTGVVNWTPVAGTQLRIVQQPAHGTVAVNNNQVTYYPTPGYAGADRFTYAVSNGTRESGLGVANVTVTTATLVRN